MKLKLNNKNQLSTFLKLITLPGLDEKAKSVNVFNEIVIRFNKDKTVSAHGFMRVYGIYLDINSKFDMEIDENMVLSIPFIDVWGKFIDEIPGKELIIDKRDDNIRISSGDGNTFYEINIHGTEQILTYTQEPLMMETDEGFHSTISDTDYNDYSVINFNAKKLLESITPGKIIFQLLVEMTLSKKGINIVVGSLGGGSYAKHTTKNVPEIDVEEWIHGDKEKWINSAGLHSVIKVISMANESNPKMYFIGSNKVMIFQNDDADYKILKVNMMFALTPNGGSTKSEE